METFIYILYSTSLDRYYVGMTSNIDERLRRHLSIHTGFTGKAKDWKVVFHETFNSKEAAMKREKQIKSWKSRKLIEDLIK